MPITYKGMENHCDRASSSECDSKYLKLEEKIFSFQVSSLIKMQTERECMAVVQGQTTT